MPPKGLVTLVFTDVQGSTGIWERSPEVMRKALATHDAIMRETLELTGGYEVKTEGDAFMAAFGEPQSAVRWCLAVQERLLCAKWPPDLLEFPDAAEVAGMPGQPLFRGLRVRMGIHTGVPDCKPDPKTRRMDYFGPMVNRAARVGGAAHGGQILVSGSVWERVATRLPQLGSPVSSDLGEHRLKGLESLERLVMVLPASLAQRKFPSPKTLNPNRTNLPQMDSSFVGRDIELDSIDELLAKNCRLLTLTGPGGMGKTRMASHYGAIRLAEFSGPEDSGVWFCDASEALRLMELCEAVGRALNVHLAAGLSEAGLVEQLGNVLAGRSRFLLIIDNFEQLVQHAPATIGRWMKMAPKVIFLVTSRESLRLRGEMVLELSPLSLPESAADPASSAAVQLFLERAEGIRPGCITSPSDLPVVGQIVRRLDGIPLAIELASARMGMFSPTDLLSRLSRHLDILASGMRDSPDRQATLRKTIDWSWNLLEPWEQQAFAQCSLFHGGFDLEAAENILDVSDFPQAPSVLEIVQALRSKSLLRSYTSVELGNRLRFAMYVTVQEYAREKFLRRSEREQTLDRHAAYYLKLGRLLSPKFPGGGGDHRLHQLAMEQENIRAIHQRAVTQEPPTRESANQALAAALALDPVFTTRGPFKAREEFLDSAMTRAAAAGADPALMAWACEARGRAHIVAGASDDCDAIYEKGLEFARRSGEKQAEAFLLRNIGLKKMIEGTRMEDAREKFEAALVLLQEVGDKPCEASLLGDLACYWQACRQLERAIELHEKARRLNREIGNQLLEGLALTNLAVIYQELARFDEAEASLLQALALGEKLGDGRLQGFVHGYLGCLFQETGRLAEASDSYRKAIQVFHDLGDHAYRSFFRAALGSALAQNGFLTEAMSIFAPSDPLHVRTISAPFAQTQKLHFGLYETCRAGNFVRAGQNEEAARSARLARSIFTEAHSGSLESEDVRFALRLLSKAIEGLPALPGPAADSSQPK
ncbi:MAG: adenylate/guanylate cyclase domain-containing protein [Candidatus Ozemobacteraceae bacterium]